MTALPGILAEIERVAGRDAALTIALHHGGDDGWDVPRGVASPAGEALAAQIGEVAAAAVVHHLGGTALSVPLARRALVAWLATSRGWTTREIARELAITHRTARRYRRGAG